MQRKITTLTMAAFGLLAFGTSCGGSEDADTGGGAATANEMIQVQDGDSEAVKTAKTTWQQLCVSCHGTTGAGDGPAGQVLDPKPRSFGDASWQSSVDDAHIKRIIKEGGAAVGKSPSMPGAPMLRSNDEALDHMVKIVRSFGG